MLFDPSAEKVAILLVVLMVAGAGLWLFVRSAVRAGVRGSARADRMDEVRRWERSRRKRPR